MKWPVGTRSVLAPWLDAARPRRADDGASRLPAGPERTGCSASSTYAAKSRWGAPGGGNPSANAPALSPLAAGGSATFGEDDLDLFCSIDEPAEGTVVTGELRLRGWAQDESGPTEPPDAAAAFPHIGDTSSAGREIRFQRVPTDNGAGPGGRVRTITRPSVFC